MKKKLFQLIEYFKYKYSAKGIQKSKDAFLFDLYQYLKSFKIPNEHLSLIDQHRKLTLKNKNTIEHMDMGAGAGNKKYVRYFSKVSKIAKSSNIDKKSGRLLYALVNYFKPTHILEFGTLLGLGTIYLALPNPKSTVITMEGCAELAAKARGYIDRSNVENTDILVGEFATVLPIAIDTLKSLDLVYFDGNHRYNATMEYFNTCKSYIKQDTIFIFDDIYWSEDMKKAWNEIKIDKTVTATLDFYHFGIVFFNEKLSKENFILKI